ncbi:sensor domain-containing diguanylate cyclase [Marinobacter sp. chi1]|uniref:Sensor domain-containing diguanylate cyclase n=1 Tax=Marinobacter suaedae TaxID=3057675 RepID=A0ABT8W1Q4_9GAMM|nr:sensor domain-containing diguanylate cyclase [Marinobacter sp. chi1]MDO3722178.1 sensor domain-containing diguanylate cyclase [Marinobacter sp. chi1]
MEVTRSIRSKLVAIMAISAFCFLLISAPITGYFSYIQHKDSASKQQSRLVGAVTSSASISAYVKNREIADDVISGLLLDDEILHVRLEGVERFEVESGVSITDERITTDKPTDYPLYSPIDDSDQIGSLLVWSNDGLITERAIGSVKENLAWLIIMSLLFTLVSIHTANKLVGFPLRELARQVSISEPGSELEIEVDKANQGDEIGLVARSVNNFLNVTREALETERSLRRQIERLDRHYQNIFASTNVGIMVLDENGVLLHSNPVLLERIIRVTESERKRLLSESFFEVAFRNPDSAWSLVARARKHGDTVSADFELGLSGESPVWVHCLISGAGRGQGQERLIEAVVYDVTSRVQASAQVQKMAEEDPLTGLKNRRGCQQYFDRKKEQVGWVPELAVMLLDLDGFKPINDSLGHAAGDHILQVIAERLQACVRSNIDLVGRLGGDEFVVVIESGRSSKEDMARIANKIIGEVSRPVVFGENVSVSVGVSIGIAYSGQSENFEAALDAADQAMYKVKMAGKNNYNFAL